GAVCLRHLRQIPGHRAQHLRDAIPAGLPPRPRLLRRVLRPRRLPRVARATHAALAFGGLKPAVAAGPRAPIRLPAESPGKRGPTLVRAPIPRETLSFARGSSA